MLRTSEIKMNNKPLYNKWYTAMADDAKEHSKQINENIPTDRQTRTTYRWVDVLKKYEEYPLGSKENLILAMYTLIPPRRQSDYFQLRVYNDPTEIPNLDHNHIHLCHPKFGHYMFIKEFKTANVMRPFFNKFLPEKLIKAITFSIELNPRQYMFTQADGEPFSTANAYTKYSNNILKKIFDNTEMSVNALRHSIASHIDSIPQITLVERKRIAYLMGHTVGKALQYVHHEQGTEPVNTHKVF
jgi:hypothetical protein